MRTSELTGALLDYWVAMAEGLETPTIEDTGNGEGPGCYYVHHHEPGDDGWWALYGPTRDWSLAGPIIERERGHFITYFDWPCVPNGREVSAKMGRGTGRYTSDGDTHLVAAMRAYVGSKFGDEVQEGSESNG